MNMMLLSLIVSSALSCAGPQDTPRGGPAAASPAEIDPTAPRYFEGSTAKILQLTDDRDRARRIPTRSRTATRAGMTGTDLGCSFEHNGKLWFLFGDSRGRPGDKDFMAWADATSPDDLELHIPVARDGLFRPISVPGVGMGAYEVPSHGISIDGVMYMVSTAGHSPEKTMLRSLLSRSTSDGGRFEVLYELSKDAFINVALVRARGSKHQGLPVEDTVFFFGSGDYRVSSPKLAYVPSGRIGRKGAIRYLKTVLDGKPVWSKNESDAINLFDHPVVGELSVSWVEPLQRWVMLYKGGRLEGIYMRSATAPWGPWTEPESIYDAWTDNGYAKFMHASWQKGRKDNFHDAGMENRWGGPYAPYFIDRFTTGDKDRCSIYYTMSTWNPYEVVLMRSDIGFPERCPKLEFEETLMLPGEEGWILSHDFLEPIECRGVPHVTTGRQGGPEMGVAHRRIVATTDGTMEFTFHGGEGEIVLVRETTPPPRKIEDVREFYHRLKRGQLGTVVEAIAGPNNNEVDVPMVWNLHRHVGRDLRLYIIDPLPGPRGFVNVSQIRVRGSRLALEQGQ
jgi:hypothetical protein